MISFYKSYDYKYYGYNFSELSKNNYSELKPKLLNNEFIEKTFKETVCEDISIDIDFNIVKIYNNNNIIGIYDGGCRIFYIEDIDKSNADFLKKYLFTHDKNYVFLHFRYGSLIGVCLSNGDICFAFDISEFYNLLYIDKNYNIYYNDGNDKYGVFEITCI